MKAGKGLRKFPRELSKNRPKSPIPKMDAPNPAVFYFGEEEYEKKYKHNPNRGNWGKFYAECHKAAEEVWEIMTAEQRAPYEEIYQEKREKYLEYQEEFSKEMDEFRKRLGEYIKSREEAAAAQGLTYNYGCHEPDSDEEIDYDDEDDDSEEDEFEEDEETLLALEKQLMAQNNLSWIR